MPDQETTTRIEKLEQDMAALTTRVSDLESRNGSSPATFTVEVISKDVEFATLKITGSDFQAGETVNFFINGDGPTSFTADAEGKVGQRPDDGLVSVPCIVGVSTKYTIRAHGSLSGRVEDEATVFC
ncbi:MAG TPA: hypothetical protein VF789_29290 [Thermoanaerobaculia bacterium]